MQRLAGTAVTLALVGSVKLIQQSVSVMDELHVSEIYLKGSVPALLCVCGRATFNFFAFWGVQFSAFLLFYQLCLLVER